MRLRIRRRTVIIATLVATLIGTGALATSQLLVRQAAAGLPDPFTAKQIASLKFPVYHPVAAPAGFRPDSDSMQTPEDGVVVFRLSDLRGRNIYISQQARSTTYNYGGFYNGFKQSQQFRTPAGQAVVGYLNDGQVAAGSVVSNKTWVIVNAQSSQLKPADLKLILNSLSLSR